MTGESAGRALRIGFLPLVDCAPVVAAAEWGFAAQEGLSLTLVREISWASVRDRLAFGDLFAAHMLAPLPVATALGLTPLPEPMVVPLALGPGRNTITICTALFSEMEAMGAPRTGDARATGSALAAALAARRKKGLAAPVFAVVHPFSAHNYELRHWLAAAGLVPDRDVTIAVVPPPLMPEALAKGQIEGFCVGQPYGALAQARGFGRIVTATPFIWRGGVDKVLALPRATAEAAPDVVDRLVRAVARAAAFAVLPENRAALAELLARPDHLDCPVETVRPALEGAVAFGGGTPVAVPEWGEAAVFTRPNPAHALWFAEQMRRWGQWEGTGASGPMIDAVFRPDLWDRAGLSGAEPPALAFFEAQRE